MVVRGDRATVTLREGASVSPEGGTSLGGARSFSLRLPDSQATPDNGLIDRLEAQGVNFRFESPSQWPALLLNFLPALLLLTLPLLLLAALLFLLFWRRSPPPG